jgi:hypothetical protein
MIDKLTTSFVFVNNSISVPLKEKKISGERIRGRGGWVVIIVPKHEDRCVMGEGLRGRCDVLEHFFSLFVWCIHQTLFIMGIIGIVLSGRAKIILPGIVQCNVDGMYCTCGINK